MKELYMRIQELEQWTDHMEMDRLERLDMLEHVVNRTLKEFGINASEVQRDNLIGRLMNEQR